MGPVPEVTQGSSILSDGTLTTQGMNKQKTQPRNWASEMTSIDLLKISSDLLKTSIDLLKTSVDLLKTSVDFLRTSVSLLKTSVDLLKT